MIMKRFLNFSIVLILAATGPVWLFIGFAGAYAFFYGGIELLVLGALIDAYYMSSITSIPWYTIMAGGALVLVELIKPHLLLYNQS